MITRYKQDDLTGESFNAVIDDYRTLTDLVNDNLTNDWASTIDLTTVYPDVTQVSPEIVQWDSRPCWRAAVEFRGTKIVDA